MSNWQQTEACGLCQKANPNLYTVSSVDKIVAVIVISICFCRDAIKSAVSGWMLVSNLNLKYFKGLVHPPKKLCHYLLTLSNPWDLHSSSEHKLRYFWCNLRALRPSIDSNGPYVIKVQKRNKEIGKIIHVTRRSTKSILIASYKYRWAPDVTWIILPISLLYFWTLIMSGHLLSMEGLWPLRFHKKYFKPCSPTND